MRRCFAVSLLVLGLAAALTGFWAWSCASSGAEARGRRAAWVRLTGLSDPALGAGFPGLRNRALAEPASLWSEAACLREAYPPWPLGAPPAAWRGAATGCALEVRP